MLDDKTLDSPEGITLLTICIISLVLNGLVIVLLLSFGAKSVTSHMILIVNVAVFIRNMTVIPYTHTDTSCKIVGPFHFYAYSVEVWVSVIMIHNFLKSLSGPYYMPRSYFYCMFVISSFPSIFGAIFNEFIDVGVSCGTDNKPSIISRTLSLIYLVIAVCISACEIILILFKIRKLPKELLSAIKNKIMQGVGLYAISTLSVIVIPVGCATISYMIHGKYIASEYFLDLSGYVVGILYAGIFFIRKEHVEVSPFCFYAILLL
jgi:hypothetical protein